MNFIMLTRFPHSRRYDLCTHYVFIILLVSSEKPAWATTGERQSHCCTSCSLMQFNRQ